MCTAKQSWSRCGPTQPQSASSGLRPHQSASSGLWPHSGRCCHNYVKSLSGRQGPLSTFFLPAQDSWTISLLQGHCFNRLKCLFRIDSFMYAFKVTGAWGMLLPSWWTGSKGRKHRKGPGQGRASTGLPTRHHGLLPPTRLLLFTSVINLSRDEFIHMLGSPRSSHLPFLQSHQWIACHWQSSPQYIRLWRTCHIWACQELKVN